MKVKIIYLFNDNRCQFRGNIATFAYFSRDLIQSWVSQLIVDFHLMIFSRMKSNIMPENQTIVCDRVHYFICSKMVEFYFLLIINIVENLDTIAFLFRNFVIHVTDVSCTFVCVRVCEITTTRFLWDEDRKIDCVASFGSAGSEKGIFDEIDSLLTNSIIGEWFYTTERFAI